MKFVCPQPRVWDRIYRILYDEWIKRGKEIDPPPVPLILNGWVFSTDFEKNHRWIMTEKWAEDANLTFLIPELLEEDKYLVEKLSDFSGYGWQNYDYKPKQRPFDEEILRALYLLKKDWVNIVGDDIGNRTSPIKFTGKKRRRLVVIADENYLPPWGTWRYISYENKNSFTKFRSAINKEIKPVYVDHVDFEFYK